jgi:Spy/CpxP family protein refolding chaperone
MVSFCLRRTRRFLMLTVTAFSVAAGVAASEASPIKALTPETVEGYLAGKGMEAAKAAELNGYPGPRHVLDLADRLHLTPAQLAAVEAAHASMKTEARRLGRAVVEKEAELDRLFASGRATAAEVDRLTAEIAVLQGQLRAAHLKAHLAIRPLFDGATVARYNALRGYGSAAPADPHRH